MTNDTLQALFVVFALLMQVLLIVNFVARNWKPSFERKYGWLIYAMGIPGITLGILFLVGDQPWYIVAAPFVYSIWGAFGYFVDIYRPVQWRSSSGSATLTARKIARLAQRALTDSPRAASVAQEGQEKGSSSL